MSKKLLIVQFRTDESLPQEQNCYKHALAQYADNLVFVNAIQDQMTSALLENVGGVIFGGSGQLFLGEDQYHAWLPAIDAFIDELYARDIPLFGVCFGHQIILQHEGATVAEVPEMQELGTFAITKLSNATEDPLFGNAPAIFDAILAHKRTPIQIPPSVTILCSSERVEASATRINGRRVWSTMFHPEEDCASARDRFLLYPQYAQNKTELERVLANFRDAPEAQKILQRFAALAMQL